MLEQHHVHPPGALDVYARLTDGARDPPNLPGLRLFKAVCFWKGLCVSSGSSGPGAAAGVGEQGGQAPPYNCR